MNVNLLSTVRGLLATAYWVLPTAYCLLTAAGPDFRVQRLEGDSVLGPIVELSADRVTIQTDGGPVSLKTDEVAWISSAAEPGPAEVSPRVWVELVDGSRLVGADYSAHDGLARITGLAGPFVELPTRDVVSVRLQAQTDAVAAQWSEILALDVDGDLLVIRKAESLDYHRGVVGDVDGKVVRFDLDGDVLPVKRTKVQGLIHYQSAGRTLPASLCRITEAGGSRWQARSIRFEGGVFHWTTPLGLEVARPAGQVVRLDFSEGKIVYLSDLDPESVAWTPYFGPLDDLPALAQFFSPREDRSLDPGPLELDGKQYRKGLALHSRTRLVYRLPGAFRRFKATVGIDDRVRPRGHVRLVVRGDDRVLLDATVAGTDPPKPVDLDLAGVRRLTILVDYGDGLDVADHLDLCDARIVK